VVDHLLNDTRYSTGPITAHSPPARNDINSKAKLLIRPDHDP